MVLILDATSAFRSMWLNKHDVDTVFMDVHGNSQLCEDWKEKNRIGKIKQSSLSFKLTLTADFCHLPFRDNTFNHVNFDPPHLLHLGQTSIYYKRYGGLQRDTWRHSLKTVFNELWRVLKAGGTLNLKWNTRDIKLSELLKLFSQTPRYGQLSSSGSKSHTFWFSFVKPLEVVS